MKKKGNAEELWQKYLAGTCTEAERAMVESWHLDELSKRANPVPPQELVAAHHRMRRNLQDLTHSRPGGRRLSGPVRWGIAAVLGLFLSLTAYYVLNQQRPEESPAMALNEVRPGGNKATLIVDGIEQISLDESQSVIRIEPGQVLYADGSNVTDIQSNISHQTIRTPRGGQYQIVLSDGTKVWLNAASSLQYPSGFAGEERKVQLSGEAYFEVAKNGKPFIVETADQEVEVLGTHFNINAYAAEPRTVTTLLEGSVRVSVLSAQAGPPAGNQSVVLEPNQQSIVEREGKQIHVDDTNTSSNVAWKNGYFVFDKSDIHSIMRQIGRWYDIEVEIHDTVTKERISGSIARSVNLSEVLTMLELTGLVHFTTSEIEQAEGRRIIVM